MARQLGVLKIEGPLGGLSFYKSVFGHIVRSKGGADKEKIRTHPNFVRLREHQEEFGNCSSAGKLLRQALKSFTRLTPDHTLVGRINSLMNRIKNCDTTSIRGKRTVANGINNAEGKELLKGFEFNARVPLGSILRKRVTILNNDIVINDLVPKHDLVAPKGATHVSFTGIVSVIDFAGNTHLIYSDVKVLEIDTVMNNVILSPVALILNEFVIYSLQIVFLQEVNGELGRLKENGTMVVFQTVFSF